jgi:hypothetical protein
MPAPRRRTIIRRTILLVCFVGVTGLLARHGLGLFREVRARVEMRDLQRQCLAHMAAVDQVVYDDNPWALDELLRTDVELDAGHFADQPKSRRHVARRFPAWQRFINVPKDLYSTPIFLHGRRCGTTDEERLSVVAIRTRFEKVTCPTIQLDSCSLAPITAWSYPEVNARHHLLTFPALANDVQIRFYAGQPDPKDASRLTIPFEAGGAGGVIEGDVLDDGMIWLRVSAGLGKISN